MSFANAIPGRAATADSTDDAISADRPGLANGTGIVARGAIQFEAGAEWDRGSGGSAIERDFSDPALLRYGLVERVELRMESGGWSRVRVEGSAAQSGVNYLALELKTGVREASGRAPAVSLLAGVRLPTGSRDFTSNYAIPWLTALAGFNLTERVQLGFNLIGSLPRHDETSTTYVQAAGIAALSVQLNRSLSIGADAELEGPESSGARPLAAFDLTAAFLATPDLQLDASWTTSSVGDRRTDSWQGGVSVRRRSSAGK